MTRAEFDVDRDVRPCRECGSTGLTTQLNPNNNGLLVRCPHCDSKRPWGSLLYLKQNEQKRTRRPPLPNGETLDDVWARYEDRCVMCSAPKHFLIALGIGRQVHHVVPYALEGHKGPVVPICSHCHAVATDRQRLHWFYRRVVLKDESASDLGHNEGDFVDDAAQVQRTASP